ncbi:MAG TPA: hypothetical protein VM051_00520 [Usitatibacter sp.]|nr:hypothetical protein [Usitatibacter sp.]
MKRTLRIPLAVAASLAALSLPSAANPTSGSASAVTAGSGALPVAVLSAGVPKAISTNVLASRATVTPTATLFGGFAINTAGTVYIAVRGNSLGTLGITQNFLDAPRTRLYNQAGQDMVTDVSGNAGFNACVSGSTFGGPVVSYYQNVRGAPVVLRDACIALTLQAGVYTFSVTPSSQSGVTSVPSSGEVLFEVTLNP